jgi:molecular chaperone DnaK
MIREAEENAEADKRRKEEADLRNEADQVIFQVKKAVQDLGDEVTDQEKKDVEEKTKDLEDALKGNDLDLIRNKKDELLKVSQNIAMRAYQKSQTNNQDTTESTDDANEEKVVDAEFEDVD